MRKQGKKWLRPLIIFLIGIIITALAFTLWFYTVPPISSLATRQVIRDSTSNSTSPGGTFLEYFGIYEQTEAQKKNASRPVDHSVNTTLYMTLTPQNGPAQVLVYIGNQVIFNQTISTTTPTIICNTTRYMKETTNNTTPPPPGIFRNIESLISTSLIDAFTGGSSPYILIKNLNSTTRTNFNYKYSYSATYRNNNGIPAVMFIIGIIIVIIEGIGLLRITIKRLRKR